tara:strand:- start:38 stop:703 length:666 start_codon:yes stop_codon:yes gene_type:complete
MRYELKFVFNNHELFKFKSWLISETRFKKKYSPRIVNSIYFDDINNGSANDNLAGISLREKYRLRWYNNDFNNLAKFELKKRINRLNFKEFFNFNYSKKNTKNLSNKNFADIYQNKLFEWNYKYNFELFPKIQIQYNREYYEDNKNVRLTIDKKLKFWKSLDNEQMFCGYPLDYELNIAEIKFTPDLYNYVSILLNQTRFIPKRHSKYLIGLALFDEVKYF